ncbi:hypothetical protein [Asticcacaulis machinosus]|uniref:Uncharacterized protein n=1 Tax=Asticcacaulis machinosus TaxID=2984211 RepID=A0ABT5HGM7_9CAUL|nr:hypothetical protein [Asticcacaulis machinosus]MDC7675407.1 hypothetical protein [Asticcacaulis machinosus]
MKQHNCQPDHKLGRFVCRACLRQSLKPLTGFTCTGVPIRSALKGGAA